jgi:hypothetical protein
MMQTAALPVRRGPLWAGRILTGLTVLMLLASAAAKLLERPEVVDEIVGRLGYPLGSLLGLALIEIACVALYAIPRTAVLGAVLLTGYLGGAIASHVRIGEAPLIPAVLGLIAWGGIYFRDDTVRALLPLRRLR